MVAMGLDTKKEIRVTWQSGLWTLVWCVFGKESYCIAARPNCTRQPEALYDFHIQLFQLTLSDESSKLQAKIVGSGAKETFFPLIASLIRAVSFRFAAPNYLHASTGARFTRSVLTCKL